MTSVYKVDELQIAIKIHNAYRIKALDPMISFKLDLKLKTFTFQHEIILTIVEENIKGRTVKYFKC